MVAQVKTIIVRNVKSLLIETGCKTDENNGLALGFHGLDVGHATLNAGNGFLFA